MVGTESLVEELELPASFAPVVAVPVSAAAASGPSSLEPGQGSAEG